MNPNKDIIIKDREILQNNSLLFNFNNESRLIHIFKKTEKMVSAIFIITSYFEKEEPLKLSLRNSALDLFKTFLNFNKNELIQKQQIIRKANQDVLELISYFKICFLSDLISENNFLLIESELSRLSQQILELEKGHRTNIELEHAFFKVDLPEKENPTAQIPQNIGKYSKGQDFLKMSFKGNKNDFMSFMSRSGGTSTAQKTGDGLKKDKQGHVNNDKKERQNIILEEIKIKGEVTIKDITDKIPNVSEKTIQRELLKLVEQNVLYKEGERRWSKYKIKN